MTDTTVMLMLVAFVSIVLMLLAVVRRIQINRKGESDWLSRWVIILSAFNITELIIILVK
ncbi:hypothetical protein B5F76_07685 [Desulfovibrio sp. An276]|uniref:hypothetical protein n=1 Tax=Desulfovibrio sp. An276 TaxID=1965618 RepID=UPI000B37C398|nr:hypothetical protein [Desulfovibrio sp. An276]OUO52299.1 hypothetical protein B5F76_07685 [Desulfovibrio sp. An276]